VTKFNPNLVILDPLQAKLAFEHAISGMGIEVCGILGGQTRGNLTHIQAAIPVVNRLNLPDRFESDPASHFSALRKIRANQLEWVGTYHSHPFSPPIPSKWDLQMAQGGGMVDLILGFVDGALSGRFWDFCNRRPIPVTLAGDRFGPLWEIFS
jgi:proteasome lid subunit RPN8/RPN11